MIDHPCRIVVVCPPPGVVLALQRGKADIVSPVISTGADLSFDLTIRLGERGEAPPDPRGPFVQGVRGGRFIYVNSGSYAGQTNAGWNRRAKIGLSGITWDLRRAGGGFASRPP